jgi:hypothetical protein
MRELRSDKWARKLHQLKKIPKVVQDLRQKKKERKKEWKSEKEREWVVKQNKEN